jgi:hypothetical protein
VKSVSTHSAHTEALSSATEEWGQWTSNVLGHNFLVKHNKHTNTEWAAQWLFTKWTHYLTSIWTRKQQPRNPPSRPLSVTSPPVLAADWVRLFMYFIHNEVSAPT